MSMLHEYNDRKKLKWNGFYLSEHTRQLADQATEEAYTQPAKPLLTMEEIDRILYEAKLRDRSVAVQKEEVNEEGHYPPDIIGKIQGYDELGIYIGGEKIHYDEIRNVEFQAFRKWSEL